MTETTEAERDVAPAPGNASTGTSGTRATLLRRAPLWALIAVPVLLGLAEAIRSPRLNFVDYWLVLGNTTNADGSLNWTELFSLYHEHPILVVGIVFWLDANLFDGANYPLGIMSVVLAGGILASLASMLSPRLRGTKRLAVIAALSGIVFSSAATEYFGLGMMGVQWLLGVAPAVVAIAFAHRGRTVPAILFAVLGSLGHGAAFPVWIALPVVAWLRRDQRWRVLLPLALGVCVFVVWQLAPWPESYPKSGIVGLDTHVGAMFTTLGQVWSFSSVDLALFAGAVTVGVLAMLAVGAVRQRLAPADGPAAQLRAEDAGWFGVVTQVLFMAAMIGASRGGVANTEGLAPRYCAVALLGVAALTVLLINRGPRVLFEKAIAFALVVALATYAIGSTSATATREKYPVQPVLGVAMQVGANSVVSKEFGYPEFLERYRTLGVYPFTDDFTLGCDGGPELGGRVDLAATEELPAPAPNRQTAGVVEKSPVVGDTEIRGWALIEGAQADCVLITDQAGTVVGGGAVGLPRLDVTLVVNGTGRSGWAAVAAPGTTDGVVLVQGKGKLYRVASKLPEG
ncbi:hypothetical protein CFN78_27375 [Amycolatopsis antarctica]|uniref:Uncharacterized protein n=1 Tax=Amycolatopsis antarctica TaxID=1854586 RepID=A0A263CVA6_9PSEU|nr:hypothetical protein [Amycolatopsis antarctica]OZM70053.1 hypothetical protein CFN78_27375 [Amycolatopsis antarctica]